MVQFIKTWVTVIVVFIILDLTMAIFSPIITVTFSQLVDIYAYNNAALLMAKTLVVRFFGLFPYIMGFMLLFYGVVQSLRREEDTYV